MSVGRQNEMLTSSPQITYWRYRHMRYTEFALEHTTVNSGSTSNLSPQQDINFEIPRSGDLVNDLFAVFHLPGLANVATMASVSALTTQAGVTDSASGNYGKWDGSNAVNEVAGDGLTSGAPLKCIVSNHATADHFDGGAKVEAGRPYPGMVCATEGAHTLLGNELAGSLEALAVTAAGQTAHTWVQLGAGPDPVNMNTSWDAEARCMRPTHSMSALADKVILQQGILSDSYQRISDATHPREDVQFLNWDGTIDASNNNTRTSTHKNLLDFAGSDFECVESPAERKRIHQSFYENGEQALTVPGPQPYWCNSVGQYLIDEVKLKVGSQIVDHLYDHYLNMWDELSDKPGRRLDAGKTYSDSGYGQMTMRGDVESRKKWSKRARSVYVPIPMFFMRTSGNALPLIALQFHGVQITLRCNHVENAIVNNLSSATSAAKSGLNKNLYRLNNNTMLTGSNDASSLWPEFRTVVRETSTMQPSSRSKSYPAMVTGNPGLVQDRDIKVTLLCGFVFLGVGERNKFADASFEILIDQVQEDEKQVNSGQVSMTSLAFNHCVQELMWAVHNPHGLCREPFDYTGNRDPVTGESLDALHTVQLKLNNSTRFNEKNGQDVPAEYFRTVQPYLHHTRVPDNHVYCYSFALNPESEQPSGALNFSRVDNARMEFNVHEDTRPSKDSYDQDCLARRVLRKSLEQKESWSDRHQANKNGRNIMLYARNWNCFRVTLGLGGVKWAS